MQGTEPLIFDLGVPERTGLRLFGEEAQADDAVALVGPLHARASDLGLPEVSERDVVAHFTRLSRRQYAVDVGFYPLGSCTMKYNPKLADAVASLRGFLDVHPAAEPYLVQGWLEVAHRLQEALCRITGMQACSLQPPAGAAGELTGLLIAKAFLRDKGRDPEVVLIPDSAHGTNPASVTVAGMKAVGVKSSSDGLVEIRDLAARLEEADGKVAAMMMTNPNTLGLFEKDVAQIAEMVHEAGALMYYDGANLNAVLGIVRPADMGFDIAHLNLHKTFATPHGGGGPGSGPVAVVGELSDYLPSPLVARTDAGYALVEPERSIGRMHAFFGNALVWLRALSYILLQGDEGLKEVARTAVLNANWLAKRISHVLPTKFAGPVMHEFVATAKRVKEEFGVRAMDLCKALLEEGFHAPTVNFPLLVEEALMIEPTETESLQTLEAFAEAIERVISRIEQAPNSATEAPANTVVARVDEVKAARELRLTYEPDPGRDDDLTRRTRASEG
jgi:glycine dehydrogenase subunit 2